MPSSHLRSRHRDIVLGVVLASVHASALGACVTEDGRRFGDDTRDTAPDEGCPDDCDYAAQPPCITFTWDAATCQCQFVPSEEGAPCDDGNACTLEDRCSANTCRGEQVDLRTHCDDGNPCTVDNCDQRQGCVHDAGELVDSACDDGNQCTFDSRCADDGRCRWTNQYVCGVCDPGDPDPCGQENLAQDACHGRLVCDRGYCEVDPASVPRCDDPRLDPCLVPSCEGGACTTTARSDGSACSDGSPCTAGDQCLGGVCTGTPTGVAVCACDGDDDCAALDDDDLCNGRMRCVDDVCRFDFASIVVVDGSGDDPCSVSRCDPATGQVEAVVGEDGASCDDDDPCTTGDQCQGGVCSGAARDCGDFDGRCLVGQCDRLLGCVAVHAASGAACDPAEPCSPDGSCDGDGDCVAARVGCDDGDPCTADVCDDKTDACSYIGPDKPECAALGECAGGVPLGCERGEYFCDYGAIATWSAVEKCDARDDDCDGETDDACIAGEACAPGTLGGAWSGTMQACTGPTTVADARCGSGWHVCSYSSMVDSLAGSTPPSGYYIAASIAFAPASGYSVADRAEGCFEFDGVCTNVREVQAMTWDGVFGSTIAYAAEAWGCDGGMPAADCGTVEFQGVMCCADECDGDDDCIDQSPCTDDRCVGGRCDNAPTTPITCATVGVCAGVAPVCRPDGTLACGYEGEDGAGTGAWEPVESRCDGLDNDCDGRIDAADGDFVAAGEPCELAAGVCAGAVKRAGACVDGAWGLCGASDYAATSAFYEDAFEGLCDGRDNNCDGATDGGFAWHGAALGAACDGEGACGAGVVECAPSLARATCSTNPLGTASDATGELCNGLDDDCDGATDEEVDLDPAASDCKRVGVCAGASIARCVSGAWQCDYDVAPGYGGETCDGLDNDCDGATDEDSTLGGAAIGSACGPAACPNGVVVCNLFGTAAECSSVEPDVEVCDGVDNDCQGGTDEGLTYVDPIHGTRNLGQTCSGRGACGAGVVQCGDALRATCSTLPDGAASQATPETCNGVDDDCDGDTDEGQAWHGIRVGQACDGTGACGVGTVVCVDGRATCSTHPEALAGGSAGGSGGGGAAVEVCNGVDDDCDGATDEALEPSAADCPVVGVCRLEMVAAACVNGAWVCDHDPNPYHQDVEVGRCDRLDNDCDGQTDEDFAALGDACDGDDDDACALGVVMCDPADASATVCVGDSARAELCNGEDDDCDGLTDEPGAAGCTVYYVDEDGDGFGGNSSRCGCAPEGELTATVGGDCDDGAEDVHPTAPELCNGVDDDCDARTDAQDAADLVVDHVEPCELQDGVCAGTNKGANRCVGGAWQPCATGDYLAKSAAYQSGRETRCDGLDNDCDGDADGADADIAVAPPLCELQMGVCGGLTKPVALCGGGGWAACTIATYEAHAADYEDATEVSCDGADNDCDGLIDDDFAYGGKKVGQGCDGVGACGLGTVECDPSGDAATCSTNPDGSQPQGGVEACNRADDDCDGETDEGLGLAESPCRVVGVCAVGAAAACSDGAWACDYEDVAGYQAGVEATCDDLDNDCDGQTDEDMSATVNGQVLRRGDACGSGGCEGVMICNAQTAAPGDIVCSTEVTSGAEICDGFDNDCDGATDENLFWQPPSGVALRLGQACDGYGACGAGVVECTATGGTACSSNPDGSDPDDEVEVCNGVDDDCDRTSDEGFAWQGVAVGATCNGTGACGSGVVECLSAQASTCSTNPNGSEPEDEDEVCNGQDDDCDGATDEGLDVFDSPCRVVGVCRPDLVVATCTGAGGWACDYDDVPHYHAGDEVGYCDARDNDCDGQTDEDYPELGDACDLPDDPDQCAYGAWACSAAAADPADASGPIAEGGVPVCVGDTPSPEKCGGGDDDCDGATDEEGAVGCQVYFKDKDKDGFGLQNDFKCLCAPSSTYTATVNAFDCDDGDEDVNPGEEEQCNEIDDNCVGGIDEDGTEGCEDYFYDGDEDGWGVEDDARCLCFDYQGDETGHTTQLDGDCDDELETVHPGAPERCDGRDNDCDNKTDDADPPVIGCTTWYYDNDQDTFGVGSNTQCRCQPGDKYTATVAGDLCDTDNRTKPTQGEWFPAVDACNSYDYNCSTVLERQVTTWGSCTCGVTGGLCVTQSQCVLAPGWVPRGEVSANNLPVCGEQAMMIVGCRFENSCLPQVEPKRQHCH